MQDLGRYPEGQGHSMTLQQKRIRPITLLFEVGFYKPFDRNDNYIEMMCHYLAHCFGSVRTILHYTKKSYLNSQFQWSTEEGMCPFCTS